MEQYTGKTILSLELRSSIIIGLSMIYKSSVMETSIHISKIPTLTKGPNEQMKRTFMLHNLDDLLAIMSTVNVDIRRSSHGRRQRALQLSLLVSLTCQRRHSSTISERITSSSEAPLTQIVTQ
ncbi:hypothetical protein C482_13685 [Natrialba chahannaoensis JCM 10990]|uniref:Uncharacterized protein n=1 Tax=Natrialba chahannaoensis JCM 10990 TaxID=1227492 RepID=M0AFG5_9EURY|nr:hypothetical protein C482_13685 [Natrialba chahannaoensis JCM 10990]